MSPNVEEEPTRGHEQTSGTLPEHQLLPEDEPQSRRKEEIKEEVTPKSEPAAVETKEEQSDQDEGAQNSDVLHEELQRSINELPPHDSEDSLGPEHVADELRRLAAELPPRAESVPQRDPRVGATAPEAVGENNGPYAPQRSRRDRGRPVSPDPFMFHTTIEWNMIKRQARVHTRNQ